MDYRIIIGLFVMFASFPAWVAATIGVQDSISKSWYALGDRGPLFTLWLVVVGFSMLIALDQTGSGAFFASAACLCFCGVAAEYKQKMTGTVHVIGAVGGIGSALLGLGLVGVWWPSLATLAALGWLAWFRVNNRTWWVEIVGALSIIGGLASLQL